MSRTYKDRPYWVRLNDEGFIQHNHSGADRLGRTSRIIPGPIVKDEDGNPLTETVERHEKASWIAEHATRTKDYVTEVIWPVRMVEGMLYSSGSMLRTVKGKGINPIWQEAQNLVNQGKGDTLMVYSTYEEPVREKKTIEFSYECDGHLPARPWRSDRPTAVNCTRALPPSYERRWCSCDRCKPGGVFAEKRSRTARKNTLRAMAKAYDGSEDWDDEYEARELYLSKPLRYTSQWC